MKRKKLTACLILLAMAFSIFGGSINSQAKKKSISLNKKKITLQVGQRKRLKVKGTAKKIIWSSSNKKVATVSKKGVVKAKKKGRSVITAKAGKWRGKAKVIVKENNTTARPQNNPPAETQKPDNPVSSSKPAVTAGPNTPTEKPDMPTALPVVPTAEPDATEKPGDGSLDTDISKGEKIPEELQEIPSAYFSEADRKGSLVELRYETYESKTYEQKSKKLDKRAIVYLPYGYTINRQICIC